MADTIGSLAIKIAVIDLASRGLRGLRSRIAEIAKDSKEASRHFDSMVTSGKRAAMSAVATAAAYRTLKPAIGYAATLQEELIGVRAQLMGSGRDARALAKDMAAIKRNAFNVQAWSPFDMGQVVALQKELAKGGLRVGDIVGKSGAAAAAAAMATVEQEIDPVFAGKALIGIATPFQLAGDQYMTLADKITRAASASITGVAPIVETAKYAAGPMSAMRASVDDLLALSAAMANISIQSTMAGTALSEFYRNAIKMKELRTRGGALKPLPDLVASLRKMTAGMTDAELSMFIDKKFGVGGNQVARAMLNTGQGSYEEVVRAMRESASLMEKIVERMKGFNAQKEALIGTGTSTLALLFEPALAPATKLLEITNAIVGAFGKGTMKFPGFATFVSTISYGALSAGALAALVFGAKAWRSGGKFLRGVGGFGGLLRGLTSTAGGIAAGNAVEAATGVKPVFVTNWPAGFGVAGIGGMAGGAAGIPGKGGMAAAMRWGGLAALGVGGGYAIGSALNWLGGKNPALSAASDNISSAIAYLFSPTYRRSRAAMENLENNTIVNVTVSDSGRVTADTTSTHGRARTKINSVPRGAYGH